MFNDGDIESTNWLYDETAFGRIQGVDKDGDVVSSEMNRTTVFGFNLQMELTLMERAQTCQLWGNPKDSSGKVY